MRSRRWTDGAGCGAAARVASAAATLRAQSHLWGTRRHRLCARWCVRCIRGLRFAGGRRAPWRLRAHRSTRLPAVPASPQLPQYGNALSTTNSI